MTASTYQQIVCTPWCTVDSHEAAHDPACWGPDHDVYLTLEEGYPVEVLPEKLRVLDPPRLGAYPYRAEPGYREVVYLHVYRPSDNDHLSLDSSVHLTVDEAVQFANALLAAVGEIGEVGN
jgi:hypothetical protein